MSIKKLSQIIDASLNFKKKICLLDVNITPTLASELLTLNTNNRPLRDHLVKEYSNGMLTGDWIANDDTIRITTEGVLQDGQHRLVSIVKTGISCLYNIITGTNPEAFKTIDTGRNRSASDVVALMNFKNPQLFSSLIKFVIAWKDDTILDSGHRTKVSNGVIVNFIERSTPEEIQHIEESTSLGRHYYNISGHNFFSSHIWAFIYYALSSINKEEATVFMDLFATGNGVGVDTYSSIYHLRKKAFFNTQNSYSTSLFKISFVFKAWNLFRTHKHCKNLVGEKTFCKPI